MQKFNLKDTAVKLKEINNLYKITPIVKALKGAFIASDNFSYKTELLKELSKKYL